MIQYFKVLVPIIILPVLALVNKVFFPIPILLLPTCTLRMVECNIILSIRWCKIYARQENQNYWITSLLLKTLPVLKLILLFLFVLSASIKTRVSYCSITNDIKSMCLKISGSAFPLIVAVVMPQPPVPYYWTKVRLRKTPVEFTVTILNR